MRRIFKNNETFLLPALCILLSCSANDTKSQDSGEDICVDPPAAPYQCDDFCDPSIVSPTNWGSQNQNNPVDNSNDNGQVNPGVDDRRRDGCLHPNDVKFEDGAARIDGKEMYFEMASPDSNNEWGTKFVLRHVDTDDSWFYFMNRRKHSPHWSFTQAIGCNDDYPSHSKLGNIFYRPAQFSPSGEVGYFLFNVELDPDREQEAEDYYTAIGKAYQHLVQGMPILEGNLGFITMSNAEKELIRDNQALFDALSFPVTELENLAQGGFLSLNPGETFGREPRDLPVTYDPKGQIANRFEPPVMPTTYIIRLGDAPDKPDPKGFINLSKKLLGGD